MKAILVIETDAKHIEDLYVEHIWNDFVPIDLGKEYHFKPMPKEEDIYEVGMDEEDTNAKRQWNKGWNACLDEITGETE